MNDKVVYRDYYIIYDPPPIPIRDSDWQWYHKDYDGPEDSRCGASETLEQAKQDIDWFGYEEIED